MHFFCGGFQLKQKNFATPEMQMMHCVLQDNILHK